MASEGRTPANAKASVPPVSFFEWIRVVRNAARKVYLSTKQNGSSWPPSFSAFCKPVDRFGVHDRSSNDGFFPCNSGSLGQDR